MSNNKKILFIIDRNKQVVASGVPRDASCKESTYFLIDYVGDVQSIERDAYFLDNDKLEVKKLPFTVCEHLKIKNDILKIDKRRRDARSKSQNAFYSVISYREVVNGN